MLTHVFVIISLLFIKQKTEINYKITKMC